MTSEARPPEGTGVRIRPPSGSTPLATASRRPGAGQGPRIEDVRESGRRGGAAGAAARADRAGDRAARGRGERPDPGRVSRPVPRAGRRGGCRLRGDGSRAQGRRTRPAGRARADTGRNLLFGLLAFQNNFIDRDALLAAFNSWVADRSRGLGQILLERGALSPSRHSSWRPWSRSTSGSTATTRRRAWPRSARSARSATTCRRVADPDVQGEPRSRLRATPERPATIRTGRSPPLLGRPTRRPPAPGSASSARTPGAAWARSSSPSTPS